MSLGADVDRAIARGVGFLEAGQLASGEIPVYATTDPTLTERAALDPSVFPTAIAALALAPCPEAAQVRARACRFLLEEKDRHHLWRHWTRGHEQARSLPADVDDTSCASAALAAEGTDIPNRGVLLANRRRDGLFQTWIIPRLRWNGAAHAWATLPQLAHLPTLFLFFRKTSAAPGDVDAVVNANALFYLRDFDGRQAVIDHLLAVLRRGNESGCDKWYENRFAILYFLSRALRAGGAEAEALVIDRLEAAPPANAMESAFAACARFDWGHPPGDAEIAALLAMQAPDGSWPRAALYHGGRERRADGTFAPRHPDTPHWGSEALTSAFCLETLSRWRRQVAA
jgi:hypothetical protein